ncbi:hypothetical protein JCM3774_003152 [Rhodotorula dairenensis]
MAFVPTAESEARRRVQETVFVLSNLPVATVVGQRDNMIACQSSLDVLRKLAKKCSVVLADYSASSSTTATGYGSALRPTAAECPVTASSRSPTALAAPASLAASDVALSLSPQAARKASPPGPVSSASLATLGGSFGGPNASQGSPAPASGTTESALRRQILALQRDLERERQECNVLRTAAITLESRETLLAEDLGSATAEITSLRDLVKTKDALLDQKAQQATRASSQLDAVIDDVAKVDAERVRLEGLLSEAQAQDATLQQSLQAALAEAFAASSHRNRLDAELAAAREDTASLRTEHASLQEALARAGGREHELATARAAAESERDRLRTCLAKSRDEVRSLQESLQDIQYVVEGGHLAPSATRDSIPNSDIAQDTPIAQETPRRSLRPSETTTSRPRSSSPWPRASLDEHSQPRRDADADGAWHGRDRASERERERNRGGRHARDMTISDAERRKRDRAFERKRDNERRRERGDERGRERLGGGHEEESTSDAVQRRSRRTPAAFIKVWDVQKLFHNRHALEDRIKTKVPLEKLIFQKQDWQGKTWAVVRFCSPENAQAAMDELHQARIAKCTWWPNEAESAQITIKLVSPGELFHPREVDDMAKHLSDRCGRDAIEGAVHSSGTLMHLQYSSAAEALRVLQVATDKDGPEGADAPPTSSSRPSAPAEPYRSTVDPSDAAARPRAKVRSASAQLAEARRLAHEQVQRLANTLNTSARKQAGTIAASIQALELERKLKEVGGKINHATGYEEIERLRHDVGEKEKALLVARENAIRLKQAYTERVKMRADSQREVNDLLQRKATWTGPDVIRFTELVQTEHENDRAEKEAKQAMDAAEAEVEKGFSGMMQAILERYHEEQVWSDKIRSMSTYGSLAITSLNVLLFIISLLLIEPWRRRRLVENVEERLRKNAEAGQETAQAQLATLHELLEQAQATIDAVAAATVPTATSGDLAVAPVAIDSQLVETDGMLSDTLLPPAAAEQEEESEIPRPAVVPTAEKPPKYTPDWAIDEVKHAIEGHEVLAAGAAGAVGGLALAGVFALLGR